MIQNVKTLDDRVVQRFDFIEELNIILVCCLNSFEIFDSE